MGDGDEFEITSSAPAEGHSVCGECFDDADIRQFIEASANSHECDFCGRKACKRALAAPLDQVFEFIGASVGSSMTVTFKVRPRDTTKQVKE